MNRQILTIQDVCDFIGGSQPPKSVFKSENIDGYIRLIQTRDYKTDNFKTFIPKELARRFCTKEEIIIGRYGPPIFQIFRGLEGAYNVALMKAKPKENILNDYLYYLLKQNAIFKYVDGLSLRTGGQTGVDVDSLNNYPVLLPDIPYQSKVIEVLKSIDDKIQINKNIDQTIEKLAKILFDFWFVQYDYPFEKKKYYKTEDGVMVWNNIMKRHIPSDWKVGCISDIGNIIGGTTPTKNLKNNFTKNGVAWITPKDLADHEENKFISNGDIDVTTEGIKSASLKIMPKGTVLLSSRAPIGYMAISRKEVTTNQGFKSLVPKNGYTSSFIYYTLKNALPTILNNSNGSTFKEIPASTLSDIPVVLPPIKLIEEYSQIIDPLFEKQSLIEEENDRLNQLREWLLPLLINGQVKVN